MSDLRDQFKELVEQVKKKCQLTQEQIADQIGISRPYLSELLNDGRREVTQKHIDKVKKATFKQVDNVDNNSQQPIATEVIQHLLKNNDKLQDMHERLIHTHEDVVYSHKKLIDHYVPNSKPLLEPEREYLKKLWVLVYKYLVKPGQKTEAEILQELGSIEISAEMEVPLIGKN